MRLAMGLLLGATVASAAIRIQVTVVDTKTGKPITDLKAGDFKVADGNDRLRVESAEYRTTPVDIMLLLDASQVGAVVQPAAGEFIGQLAEKEQMAVVAFHSSTDLVQDFTNSKQLLNRAVAGLKFGNSPRVMDALYAALDGGFAHASLRRVVLLLTTGIDGPNRTSEKEVLKLARNKNVSIYPVLVARNERSTFEMLARGTGGATFRMSNRRKPFGADVFEIIRGQYTIFVTGNSALSEHLRVEVRRAGKLFVSALIQD